MNVKYLVTVMTLHHRCTWNLDFGAPATILLGAASQSGVSRIRCARAHINHTSIQVKTSGPGSQNPLCYATLSLFLSERCPYVHQIHLFFAVRPPAFAVHLLHR